jgi:NAD(P)-dependent dehydrogenase (short-subunit alcohol dehydrogenase family)
MTWDPRALPTQSGKTFVVTGGSSGIGYFIVEQLAATGARVIIASRSSQRADVAAASVRRIVPGALLGFILLDLGSLSSVRSAASALLELGGIDGLAENAGLTDSPRRRETTSDGFEVLVGTNHLGHFALTALAFGGLRPGARVIPMGSMATRLSQVDPDDLLSERKYSPSRAYATSKHATQAFGFELDRRLRAARSDILSIVAHPGFALSAAAPRRPGVNDLTFGARALETLMTPMSQGRDRGAWPAVRALLDPDALSGQYYGPAHSVAGPPALGTAVAADYDPEFGRILWSRSEEWTGVEFTVR